MLNLYDYIYCAELNLLPMTADVKLSNIEKVIRLMERHGFPYIVSCLEEVRKSYKLFFFKIFKVKCV